VHVRAYLALLEERERQLADALEALADVHAGEPDVSAIGRLAAQWSRQHVAALAELGRRCSGDELPQPAPAMPLISLRPRNGRYGLLLDLQSAWLLAQDVHLRWTVLGQTARALRDGELERACGTLGAETDRQVAWLHTRIVEVAPQALIAAPL